MATVPPFVPDPDASFSQIIVPTSDTVCYNYLLRILVAAGKHVLYVGETGTGENKLLCLLLVSTRQAHLMPSGSSWQRGTQVGCIRKLHSMGVKQERMCDCTCKTANV